MLRAQTKSMFTGGLNHMDIPATYEQLERWLEGESMCVAMPDLTHDHIEFLVSGMTPDERRKRSELHSPRRREKQPLGG